MRGFRISPFFLLLKDQIILRCIRHLTNSNSKCVLIIDSWFLIRVKTKERKSH